MSAEPEPHGRQQLVLVVGLAPRAEALVEGRTEDGHGHRFVDGSLDRPPPLAGVGHPAGEFGQRGVFDQGRGGLDPAKNVWETVSDGLDYIKVGNTEIPSRAYVGSFGFKGPDQQKRAGVLSGGERNRLNLALTLKQGGNLLLLDEPTNDLDVETLGSLENVLLEFPGCAVVISHDRWFLDRICTHVLAFEGDSEVRWFEGNFSEYETFRHKELGTDADTPFSVTEAGR